MRTTAHNPIEAFNQWWALALRNSPLKQKSAVCVSTIDGNGFPNSRFVDLKVADDRGLVFCTSLDSAKAHDIARNAKAGMTIWWDHIGIQARFQGLCEQITSDEATSHWKSRSRDAQLTSLSFRQSHPLADLDLLSLQLQATKLDHAVGAVERPETWGGYRLVPTVVELLEFKEDRLHARTCYAKNGAGWEVGYLQP